MRRLPGSHQDGADLQAPRKRLQRVLAGVGGVTGLSAIDREFKE
jgi:hypothetical protein